MVRIISFCVWLGACAFSPLAGAQASSAQSGAKAATHVTCALACTAAEPSPCAPLGIQSGMPTSPIAQIRAALDRAGTPIGGMDLMIAAHALAEDSVVITNKAREFHRVPGLAVEAWTIEG